MKIQMIVHIKNDDGTFEADSIAIEVNVPNYEAFTGPENFGEVFDQYERKMLEARNEVVKHALCNWNRRATARTGCHFTGYASCKPCIPCAHATTLASCAGTRFVGPGDLVGR